MKEFRKHSINIFAVIILGFVLFANDVWASRLYLDKAGENIIVGDHLLIKVFLDTQDQSINAIESRIIFSQDTLSLLNTTNGNSVVNFWVEKPSLTNEFNQIYFSGLVPGGINTKSGLLLTLEFKATNEGAANIYIGDSRLYLNDSNTSEIIPSVANLQFVVSKNIGVEPKQPFVQDRALPQPFPITPSKSSYVFDNQKFISFNSQDKESGISHYEVKESFLGIGGKWEKSDSPHKLSDQKLLSIIRVRAIDNFGHERISIFIPWKLYLFYSFVLLIILMLLWRLCRKLLFKHYQYNIQ